MADTLKDLLLAIDDYMKTSHVGSSTTTAHYLATKIASLFDTPTAPFNVKSGPLKMMVTRFNEFNDKIERATNSFELLSGETDKLFKPLAKLLSNINKTVARFDTLHKRLGTLGIATKGITPGVTTATNTFQTDVMMQLNFMSAAMVSNGFEDSTFYINSTSLLTTINDSIIHLTANLNTGMHNLIRSIGAMAVVAGGSTTTFLTDNRVMRVRLVEIKEPVLHRLKEIFPIAHNTATNNPRDSERSVRDKAEKGGFISTIFGWIWTAIKWIGGIFLIGKLNQWMSNSAIGIFMKEKVKGMFSGIFGKIHTYLKSGDLGNTISDGIKGIASWLKYVFKGTKKFIENNWEDIKKNFGKIGDTLWNEIIKPIGKTIKDYVIIPLFTAIKENIMKDFDNGDTFSGVLKVLAVLGGAAILSNVIGLTGAISGLVGILTGTGGLIVALAGSAGVIAVMGSLAITVGLVIKAYDAAINYFKEQEKTDKSYDDVSDTTHKSINKLSNIINQLKSNSITNPEDKKQNDILIKLREAEIERLRILDKSVESEQNAPWYVKGFETIGLDTKYIAAQNKEFADSTAKLNSTVDDLRKQLVAATKTNSYTEAFKQTKDKFERAHIDDGIIVEPHSKDQVIAGKMGGPFDLALKDAIMKLDNLSAILQAGFSASVNATMQGSNGIIQTVANSSSKQSAPVPHGGNDMIKDSRLRHQMAIGR